MNAELIATFERLTGFEWEKIKAQGSVLVDMPVEVSPEYFAVFVLAAYYKAPANVEECLRHGFRGSDSPLQYGNLSAVDNIAPGLADEIYDEVESDVTSEAEEDEPSEEISAAAAWVKAILEARD